MPAAAHVVGILCMLVASGCGGLRSPKVAVEDVSVTNATGEALALAIGMELSNPNRTPLELYEFRYAVTVDGTQVYAGRRSGGATLSAVGDRAVSLPAVIPFERAGWSADAVPRRFRYTVTGRLVYNAPSQLAELLFDIGVRRPKVAFSRRGVIELQAPG